jgi:hypothetical protein
VKAPAIALLSVFFALISVRTNAQEIWTIGPMLHINFGGEKRTTSFTIEAAWWKIKGIPHSVDFAIEFDKGKLRLYSEAQAGIGLTGISLGPLLEFNFKEHKTRVGIQGSCWINYIVGVDYRIRYVDKNRFDSIGFYGKVPMATSGLDSDGSGFDWDDWDDDWD